MQTGAIEIKLLSEQVDANQHTFLSAEIFESVYGAAVYDVKFNSKQADFWNRIAIDSGKTPVTMRWARYKDNNEPVWSDWRTLKLKKLTIDAQAQCFNVGLIMTDSMFELKNIASRKIFKEKSATEIIKELAQDAGLAVEISDLTDQKFSLRQCAMKNYDFIKDTVLPRARKQEVLFFTKNGNVIVIKSRKKETPALNFLYKGKGDDKSIIIGSFTSVMLIDESNFGTQVVSFDSLKSQASPFIKEFFAKDDSILHKDAFASNPPPPLSFKKYPAQIQNIVVETLGMKIDDALKARVDWHYPLTMHRMVIPTYLLPEAEVGSTANIAAELATQGTPDIYCSGTHFVYAVYHRLIPQGDVGTIVFLERREIVGGQK